MKAIIENVQPVENGVNVTIVFNHNGVVAGKEGYFLGESQTMEDILPFIKQDMEKISALKISMIDKATILSTQIGSEVKLDGVEKPQAVIDEEVRLKAEDDKKAAEEAKRVAKEEARLVNQAFRDSEVKVEELSSSSEPVKE